MHGNQNFAARNNSEETDNLGATLRPTRARELIGYGRNSPLQSGQIPASPTNIKRSIGRGLRKVQPIRLWLDPKQDPTAQRRTLIELSVPEDRIYTDHGLTGRNCNRPGLAQALAAVRASEKLIVPKLDYLC